MPYTSDRGRAPRIVRKDYHLRLSEEEHGDVVDAARMEGFQSIGAFMRHYSVMAARRLKYGNVTVNTSSPAEYK